MQFSLITALKRNLNYIAILTAITFFAYVFSLNNAFVWDDEQFIYNNSYVKNFQVVKIFTENTIAGAGESSTYYRPLTSLSFAIDHQIWGLNPFGYHLTNTTLHLLTGLLLFFYLRTLRFSILASFSIACIFLIHPLQTEAVVYANSRGDSLYAFWTLTSILSFAVLLKNKYPKIKIYDFDITLGKKYLFLLTTFGYFFAILSKEIGIASLGLIGLTFLFTFFADFQKTTTITFFVRYITELSVIIPSILMAIFYMFLRTQVIAIQTTQDIFFAGTAYGENMYVRLHTFTQALWNYFKVIFIPYPLHMERTIPVLESPISLFLIATVILIITLTILSIKEYKKQKTTFIAFGGLWFLGMLVPVSGIIPVNGLLYEHWLYLPLIGFCILSYGIKQVVIPTRLQEQANEILKGVLLIVVLAFCILTIRQNYIWGNPIRFYNYTLQFSNSPRLHNNLAMSYADIQDYQNAIVEYNNAIKAGDYYPQTHHNLANTYLAIGEIELAKKEYSTAIRMNDQFYPAYVSLIKVMINQKEYKNVLPLVDSLIKSSPDNEDYKYLKEQLLIEIKKAVKDYM